MSSYTIIGLMSGTSLDGLDIAHVTFRQLENNSWEHEVHHCKSYKYTYTLVEKLRNAIDCTALEILGLDKELGLVFSEKIEEFILDKKITKKNVDAIASHGHTIFHRPELGITYQIGCGDTIAYRTGIQVINDFRQKDVISGGQGAPLVPIGDKYLFAGIAESMLNLGGFANVCFPSEETIAFDICPVNLPLNIISHRLGMDYDENGILAAGGQVNENSLKKLNSLGYYSKNAPKSLGVEWLNDQFMPIIDEIENEKDKLRTITEHVASQITGVLNMYKANSVMVTGGGAFNVFLLEKIKAYYEGKVILPSTQLIEFKEAICFGFLGALYLEKRTNTISSVTGAKRASIGGVLHIPD